MTSMNFVLDRRYFFLWLVFVVYGLSACLLGYRFNEVVYLFSDEETFLVFVERLVATPLSEWNEEIQSCYVGLFPNTNLYGTVMWYSVIGKCAEYLGVNLLLLLRATNVVVGFLASVEVVRYLGCYSGRKLSRHRAFLFTLPLLYFSPTLLRDNYVILFTFMGVRIFLTRQYLWYIKLLLCGMVVFAFRHVSVGFFVVIVFFHSRWNKPWLSLLVMFFITAYALSGSEMFIYAKNFRINFIERFSDANLSKIISLPFPINEFGLLFYSLLGVFPFYTYIFGDWPRSLIRWPELLFSLTLYFYVLKSVFYSISLRRNIYLMVYILLLFMVANIELAMRRQMIVYPLLFGQFMVLERDYFLGRHYTPIVLSLTGVMIYMILLLTYYVLI